MLTLTKMRRAHIFDHVMPSDLDKDDIKHGLYLKEKMLSEVTDEKIKREIPEWRSIERRYKRLGLDEYMEKISCGEMDYSDIPQPKPVDIDVWVRWRQFENSYYFDTINKRYGFDIFDDIDGIGLNGYTDWRKFVDNVYTIQDVLTQQYGMDILVQLKIVIVGENAIRYYPYHSYDCPSGWSSVSDDIDMWFPHLYTREDNGLLQVPPDEQEKFYRLFFRHKYTDLGSDYLSDLVSNPYYSEDSEGHMVIDGLDFNRYSTASNPDQFYPNWYLEEKEWNEIYYKGKEINTLYTDPFRLKYNHLIDPDILELGTMPTLVGRQWIKTNYKADICNMVNFTLRIDNIIPIPRPIGSSDEGDK